MSRAGPVQRNNCQDDTELRLSASVGGLPTQGKFGDLSRSAAAVATERAVHAAASNCQLPGTPFKL